MKIAVTIARILTGLLFIFSGLVKAIDPKGLAYKMQEFFEAFAQSGWFPSLMTSLNYHALTFSITIITLEVIVGVALLLGWQKKFIAWILLLLMLLFTFLTSYVLFSGKIRACGCFGDCIPITPIQTFTKDIILLVLSILILINLRFIRPIAKPLVLTIYVLTATILTLFLQYYVLNHLPVVDCLPFKKSNNIMELRKMPADAIPDTYEYLFVYEKGGEKKEFNMSQLPDSSWTFIDRKQKLLKSGKNNIPAINDFNLTDSADVDVTSEVLNQPGIYYIIFMKEVPDHSKKWQSEFAEVTNALSAPVYIVTAERNNIKKYLAGLGISKTILNCDATAIKTAARTNPAIYKMKGPVVIGKWGAADIYKVNK